ncbi:MAG: DUF2802 domain-containing protein [Gammaproteobacteria bacterium]|nr:MAG: DUF2802 domain-containing protein [Gammaproteobacteria bacterium]
MIISVSYLALIAAGTLAGTLLLALAGLLLGRAALQRARAAHAAIELAAARTAELEAALSGATAQLAELLAERERTAALPARPSLREAVALSRHGASIDELVSTCRIGQSEARLIQMLYGSTRDATEVATGRA